MTENPWIEWNGGECPVELETKVEIECDDGYRVIARARDFLNADSCGGNWWTRNADRVDALGRERRHPDDIIAYRVVQP